MTIHVEVLGQKERWWENEGLTERPTVVDWHYAPGEILYSDGYVGYIIADSACPTCGKPK